ncbi:hypothetical protein AB0L10_36060 [Streptomyces flaveolus]|uniref:hypothetical protein n=1 Tax=Streptomyces flaveolus TaxID=67297 RepID=UPI003449EB9A
MVGNRSRAAIISDPRITGLSVEVIAELVAEMDPLWHEQHQAGFLSRPRKRAVGAGAKHRVLACWFDVDRSTITRAIGEVRPLLAKRDYTVSPGVRLRTLAEVVDHLGTDCKTGIVNGTEIRVQAAGRGHKDRDKFISGKSKQNAVKTMVGHHPCPSVRAGQAPGRRAAGRDTRRRRLPGPGRADRRARDHATAPHVQQTADLIPARHV